MYVNLRLITTADRAPEEGPRRPAPRARPGVRRVRAPLPDQAAGRAPRRSPLRTEAARVRSLPQDLLQEGQAQGARQVGAHEFT